MLVKAQGNYKDWSTLDWRTKKPLAWSPKQGVFKNPGNTYFRVCCTIIGSESLTTVFGMGTGVAFPIWSPGSTAAGDKTCRGEFVVVRMAIETFTVFAANVF